MSIFSRISLLLLPLLCACSFYEYTPADDSADDPTSSTLPTEKYINLSIVVSSGNEGTTRANPNGGEEGDGREDGTQRENLVTGITLIFYQDPDNKGLNTTSDDAKIEIIKHYPVSRTTATNDGERDEAFYSTGEQPIGSDFNLNAKYHVIAVANWDLTQEDEFQVGKTIKGIRDHLTATIYSGSGIGIDAVNFVMSLEKDYTIDFSKIEPEKNGNKLVYNIEKGIHIERLAARVDFWMKGATYNGDRKGYVYNVEGESGDEFVLTAVTPFNLYSGGEYLFKRITGDASKDWSNGDDVTYLGDERVTTPETPYNYVLDPYTYSKTANTVPSDNNTTSPGYMMADYALDNFLKTSGSTYESKKQLLAELLSSTMQNESPKSSYTEGSETGDNIIICYPKENTLWTKTPLYYYATGLCIEGYYYKKSTGTSEKLIYYGFLRHQGEQSSGSYSMETGKSLEEVRTKLQNNENILKGSFPMNFGVVRNNIYRISIDKITERGDKEEPEKPGITWRIMVKNWDVFKHETIFM